MKEKLSTLCSLLFVIVYVIPEVICLICSNGFKARESGKRAHEGKVFKLISPEFKNAHYVYIIWTENKMTNFDSHLIQRIIHVIFIITYNNSYFNFIWNVISCELD